MENTTLSASAAEEVAHTQQPTQLPLPGKFDGANGPNQAERW